MDWTEEQAVALEDRCRAAARASRALRDEAVVLRVNAALLRIDHQLAANSLRVVHADHAHLLSDLHHAGNGR